MPAQPYSLGIGVQVDYQSIERAASAIERQLLNAFRGVSRDAAKYAGHITDSFGKSTPVDQLAGMLPGAGPKEALPMLPGAVGTDAPKSVDKMATALGEMAKETKPAVAELKKLDEEMKEKPKDVDKAKASMGQFAKAIGHVANAVSDFANKMRQGFAFTKDAELLEVATIRMAVGLGEGWTRANQLRNSIVDLGLATGQNVHEIAKMDAQLVNTGMTFTNFSSETQKAIIGLGHNFGLSGEQIATTSTTLGMFGQDLGNVLGESVKFQKGFKLPGVFEQLPGIVNFARDAFLSFSDKVVGSGAEIVKTAMHTAGTFAKAFGTTMADATKRAEEAMSKFAASAQQDQDVFLGLGTEFSGLTMSLMQAGVPIKRAMDMTKEGFTDTVTAAQHYREVLDRMPNKFMKDRFMRQLQKELPKDVFALVKDTKLLQKTLGDRNKAKNIEDAWNQAGVGTFNDMTTTLQSATSELRDMFNNMVQVGKAIGGQIGKMLGLDEVFAGARDTFRTFNEQLLGFVQSERFTSWMKTIKPYVVSFGKVILSVGTLIGGVAGSIGSLFGAWRVGAKGFQLAAKPVSFLASVFPKLARGVNLVMLPFKVLGKLAGKLVSKAFGIGLLIDGVLALKTAIMDMGDVIGDPNATGMEKFEALTRGVMKGVGKFIDGVFLGIPSMLLTSFFPDLEQTFDRGISGIFDSISGWFSGDGPGGILDTIGGWVKDLGGYMASNLPDFKDFAAKLGKALGGTIAGLTKWGVTTSAKFFKFVFWDVPIGILKGIGSVFKSIFGGAAKEATDGFNEYGVGDAILAVLSSAGQTILSFFYGVGDGIAGAFGTSLAAVGTRFKIVWLTLRTGAEAVTDWLYDAFANTWDYLLMGMNGFIGGASKAFSVDLPAAAKKGFAYMSLGWDVAFGVMKVVAYDTIAGVAKAFGSLAETAIDKLKKVADALPDITPGVDALRKKLDGAKATLGGVSDGFEAMAKQAKTDLVTSVAASSMKIDLIDKEKKAEERAIDAITDKVNDRFTAEIKAREDKSKANISAHRQEMDQLAQQLSAQEDLNERQQRGATNARRFQKEGAKGIEAALASFGAEVDQKNYGKTGATAGSKALKDFMDSSLKSITDRVSKGEIDLSQAQSELEKSKVEAVQHAVEAAQGAYKPTPGVGAGALAARAGNAPAAGGLNAAAMAEMFKNFRQDVRVASEVTVKGGDAVSRALVSKTQVDAMNASGGN